MKLSPRDAKAYFNAPDRDAAGVLIFGEDAMRVAMKRQELIATLIGPEGEAEMRLTRMSGAELRKDKAMLLDAVKAVGFFPGDRAAFVEDATDGCSEAIKAALADWRHGDAQIVVTAGQLTARSSLRKLFENAKNAYAAALYNNPPTRDEIEAELVRAGLKNIGRDAMGAMEALARDLPPGDFRQTLEKVALYKLGDEAPLTPAEVDLMAPGTVEAEIDEVLHAVAEERLTDLPPLMKRLEGQGVNAVTLLIFAMRHFRMLFTIASANGGPAQGIQSLRPPVFGPRRDRILRQAQKWSVVGLQRALTELMDADLTLRSAGQKAPAMALVERSFVRVAHMGRRR